ncbi:DUF3570 domain-containing protein [Chitinophaga pendula]|uniref:DUF3570 domain-containing protein n=1 Tax=Chitinophaga TaxID=79328 RepID=UPI000BAF7DFC|nr:MULTISPECIES: DUF3570 domain-containing protein [Chitinophaga]ASZ11264.1 hypothetical protein CK934_09945 [Chitinophaga sp. MD30]UCJ05736.1 DUF3570 domain-containing protein [Chitinophaga pendula]
MKKRYLLFGLLATSLYARAQAPVDKPYKKQRVSKTDIQVLFSYYTQDGDHSAVTGGIGTEALQVYAPEINLNYQRDTLQTYQLNAGVDVITSASTDRIDAVLSSASRVDARIHMNGGYSRRLKGTRTRLGIQSGFSIESDYFSIPVGVHFTHTAASGMREVGASLLCYFDDLRWGRLDPDYYRPEKLVYPAELRNTEWFSEYRRTSVNLNTSFYQVINARMQLALFPEVVYQRGLLSTPFHRVYFKDAPLRVEKLPGERWKFPIGVQLNSFTGSRVVLRSYYRFYADNFGITGHTFQLEAPIKVTPMLTLSPLIRFHTQTGSSYFQPYGQHDSQAAYYTSDYDLSRLQTYKGGLDIRFAPQQRFLRRYTFKAVTLRYAYYQRSDQLKAHMLSLLLEAWR